MSKLFNPDSLLHLCQKYGLRPSKKYGQNYLIDPSVIEKIIIAADLSSTDTVIEVGPGFGTLTFALVARAQKVFTFEIEKKLQPYWEQVLETRNKKLETGGSERENIEIVWGNVLNEIRNWKLETGEYKVVANLPYQITSPLIRTFLEAEQPPQLMVLMVQKEVAERICAKPGDMSLLSVAVQYYAKPEIVMIVPRTSFWPAPAVDSAIVRIKNYESRIMNSEFTKHFFTVVKAGFAQRRKLLIKNLEPIVGKKEKGKLKETFSTLGLKPEARAQELSVEQWLKTAERLLEIRN